MALGARLSKRRKEVHLTREALSIKTKISEGSIFNYEKGKRSPTLDHLVKLAKALHTTVSWLVEEPEGLVNSLGESDVVELIVQLIHRPDIRERGVLRIIERVLHQIAVQSVFLRRQ